MRAEDLGGGDDSSSKVGQTRPKEGGTHSELEKTCVWASSALFMIV